MSLVGPKSLSRYVWKLRLDFEETNLQQEINPKMSTNKVQTRCALKSTIADLMLQNIGDKAFCALMFLNLGPQLVGGTRKNSLDYGKSTIGVFCHSEAQNKCNHPYITITS